MSVCDLHFPPGPPSCQELGQELFGHRLTGRRRILVTTRGSIAKGGGSDLPDEPLDLTPAHALAIWCATEEKVEEAHELTPYALSLGLNFDGCHTSDTSTVTL